MTKQSKTTPSVGGKSSKKSGTRNVTAKQTSSVKLVSKKTTNKKAAASKTRVKKTPAKKQPNATKTVAKQAKAKKTAAKKPSVKQSAVNKTKRAVQYRVKETSLLLQKKTARPKQAKPTSSKPSKAKSVLYLGHAPRWNFQEHLYLPLVSSHFATDFELILSHQHSLEPANTKEMIRNANVMLAEVSYPSTGLGIEMGWAEEFDVPIIAFYQHGRSPTHCLKIVAHDLFAYGSSRDLIAKLNKRLHIESVDNMIQYIEDEDYISTESDDD